jgi:hypothetical protein
LNPGNANVAEWQTHRLEVAAGKTVRVQLPPFALPRKRVHADVVEWQTHCVQDAALLVGMRVQVPPSVRSLSFWCMLILKGDDRFRHGKESFICV